MTHLQAAKFSSIHSLAFEKPGEKSLYSRHNVQTDSTISFSSFASHAVEIWFRTQDSIMDKKK